MMAKAEARSRNEGLPESPSAVEVIKAATPEETAPEGYYGIPFLKRPTWRWHIALYFFFEGIAAGSFLLASLADLLAPRCRRALTRAGYYTSFLSFLPCPPLLIADLGRPARFLHMLRVFKPGSPMNLGAWMLTAFSAPLALLTADQLVRDKRLPIGRPQKAGTLVPLFRRERYLVPTRPVSALGLPCAVVLSNYTGVLLSTTSTPLWSRSRWLGALFACSAVHTGAAATALALTWSGDDQAETMRPLEKIENLAGACEGVALAGYLATSGKAARPLMKGRYGWMFWIGAVGAGIVLPMVARTMRTRSRRRGLFATMASSALTLAGGLALKWAITYAGQASADDAEAARAVTTPTPENPGWGPQM